MTFEEYQRQVAEWTSQFVPQYWTPHQIVSQMIEEEGEISRIINRVYGPKPPKQGEDLKDLGCELGDLLFAIVCMANREGINLDEAWKQSMDKKTERDKDRFNR